RVEIRSTLTTVRHVARQIRRGGHRAIVTKLRCCEQQSHFAHQVIGQARFRQEYVTSRLFRLLAVALPGACRQHDERDSLRAFVSLQSGDEFDTLDVTRKKKTGHDDGGSWCNRQSIACVRNGHGQESLVPEELRV